MLEDFWLPRREGGKGTEITTLPAGQNLGELEDVKYFQKKLLQSLSVPYSRLESQGGSMVGIGRTTEVTRDELKFNKFIQRLRNKFSQVFDHALRVQLALKGICTQEEWDEFKEFVYYDFKKDNNFSELKESELLQSRIQMVGMLDPFVGRYFSQAWVKKNVLKMTDEEVEQMQKEIDEEPENPALANPIDSQAPTEEQFPPEDNTIEPGANESLTPELDAEVEKYSSNINKK
jgi:hypothetical protein